MRPLLSNWTVVVVGDWNPRIFTPKWVADNVFQSEQVQTEFILGASVATSRFEANDLFLIPSDSRLVFGVNAANPDLLQHAVDGAQRVVELLQHTPIRSAGVNLAFNVEEPSDDLTRLFILPDDDGYADSGYTISQREIVRRLDGPNGIVNVRLNYADGEVEMNFNFHRKITGDLTAAAALGLFDVVALHDHALELLRELYDLDIEEDQDDEG